MKVVCRVTDADSLYSSELNRSQSIMGSINIFDREGVSKCSQGKAVCSGKVMIDDHTFSTTIDKGKGTDLSFCVRADQKNA